MGKILASVFWNSEGVIHANGVTIIVQYYSNLLHNDIHQVTRKKRSERLSKIVLLYENAHPHLTNVTKVTSETIDSKTMNHSPCRPHLGCSVFHLLGPMKMHPMGQVFQTEDEHKHSVLKWLLSQ
jgi:hypothetical protein